MQETISIQDVAKMLGIAKFHLSQFISGHHKMSGRDMGALEAYFVACLLAGASVFYTLTNRDQRIINPFVDAASNWKTRLNKERKDDYAFFFRMVDHRGSAVHASNVATEVAMSAIPAHLDPNVQVMGSPFALVPNPVSGGSPAFSQGWVMINKLRLDDADAINTLERFLGLLEELVQHCNVPLKE